MDHPNIAKVLDAGTTDGGRPFFVMEPVKGVPITQFCDERRLTPRDRLALFVPVCQAVQHAHQKGIIHRDLKPSNVMIALYDGKPVPKVIDFGIAKATGRKLTEKTLFTDIGAVVGTLEYMSPEQAELNQLDIDTRSDIYALGVILYELLTGSTPFQHIQLRAAALLESLRIIREDEPPKPSLRLSTTDELPAIAARRGLEPKKLSGLVRGELDWIVMRCLEKERSRRYETANGLAIDVQRYLADEPVEACPPSAIYRLRKFARRNKGALAVLAFVGVVLLGSVLVLAVTNVWIRDERDGKEQALIEREKALGDARDNFVEAKKQEKLANANAANAKAEEARAREQESRAKEQELLARRRYYAAQTNLAFQAWERGNPARVLDLLESQRPKFDEPDMRAFEWYALWQMSNNGRRFTLRGHRHYVTSVAFSPNGKLVASGSGDTTRLSFWDPAPPVRSTSPSATARLSMTWHFSPGRARRWPRRPMTGSGEALGCGHGEAGSQH